MYFLARKHGNHLYDPESELNIDYSSSTDQEKDSQDSNRESADQNDYPEEVSSDEDRRHKYKKAIDISSNGWLDRIMRKHKNGVTQ